MPLFTKLVYHVGSAGLEIATYMDTVGIALFQKIIQQITFKVEQMVKVQMPTKVN